MVHNRGEFLFQDFYSSLTKFNFKFENRQSEDELRIVRCKVFKNKFENKNIRSLYIKKKQRNWTLSFAEVISASSG